MWPDGVRNQSKQKKDNKAKEVECGEMCNRRGNLVANPTCSPQTIKHLFMSAYTVGHFHTHEHSSAVFREIKFAAESY